MVKFLKEDLCFRIRMCFLSAEGATEQPIAGITSDTAASATTRDTTTEIPNNSTGRFSLMVY